MKESHRNIEVPHFFSSGATTPQAKDQILHVLYKDLRHWLPKVKQAPGTSERLVIGKALPTASSNKRPTN